ncbi:MAG: TetR/AcrR family transcriptional regulator [Caulobacterales bacterium]
MPRIAGQIDRVKTEAILDAASQVLFDRGLAASMDEIARCARVSKQTVYNHYGSKAELVRALMDRRVQLIAAPLEVPGADAFPESALAAYARALLETIASERAIAIMRLMIQSAPSAPELGREAFAAGPEAGRMRLADFLAKEDRIGRLRVPDPREAADFFTGMVIAQHQMQLLLGLPNDLRPERIDRIAAEAARRFLRAYAP